MNSKNLKLMNIFLMNNLYRSTSTFEFLITLVDVKARQATKGIQVEINMYKIYTKRLNYMFISLVHKMQNLFRPPRSRNCITPLRLSIGNMGLCS